VAKLPPWSGKIPIPLVGKRVKQIHSTNEETGDAYEKEVIAVHYAAGVPRDRKDCERNNDTENLN
jgi:hypothetical protein